MAEWKARPTTYRGIQMRSRLEAKWAAGIDSTTAKYGMTWEYEPRAFANQQGQYLPDFAIYDPPMPPWYMEVRPTLEGALRALASMQIILDSEPDAYLTSQCPEGTFSSSQWDRQWRWSAS